MSAIFYLAIISLALATSSPPAAATVASRQNPAPAPADDAATSLQFLQAHNDARAKAGVAPPLTWNATLQLDAAREATGLRSNCNSLPPASWTHGRSLYRGFGNRPADAVAVWAGERRWYNPAANKCASGKTCGSYTQVVWRATRQLGCVRRTCLNAAYTVAVCTYYPPGNVAGERPY